VTTPLSVFWFRRDLRLDDNVGLAAALASGDPVLPLFIFDTTILSQVEDRDDARVSFIHETIAQIQRVLTALGSTLVVLHGDPLEIFPQLLKKYPVRAFFANDDYEPAARCRDGQITRLLREQGIPLHLSKDSILYQKNEIVKDDGSPYSVFTPYYNRWRKAVGEAAPAPVDSAKHTDRFWKRSPLPLPALEQIGFVRSGRRVDTVDPANNVIARYHETRDTPSIPGTTRLGVHLRFGTIGIRTIAKEALRLNETFLKELAWREFFLQQLWHHPRLAQKCFRKEYESIAWRNNEGEFARWCEGRTGYPLVDAGMRELAATGFMHNRVRMVAGSFLVKHLLIDWRWGAAWFARHLLDYEMASNNGNWQWVAGCGCDAAPYFRIFNPAVQAKRWDAANRYIKQWVPEWGTPDYPLPIVDHAFATKRCLQVYREALDRGPRIGK
jgi:deoxyribodipyrimidine photo-lyase